MRAAQVVARVLAGALFVAYPLLVWWGLRQGSARITALVLLAVVIPIALLRWRRRPPDSQTASPDPSVRSLALLPLITVAALGLGAALNEAGYVLAVPTVINAAFLAAFGATLRAGSMPMIERFARLQEPELGEAQRAWCRLWTWIWCGFFVVNGSLAGALAIWAPLDGWVFYTGLLSYAIMGVLFAVEWTLRRRRFG